MKILNYLSSVLCLIVWLSACDTNEVEDSNSEGEVFPSSNESYMVWKLVRMTGSLRGETFTGDEMAYQEQYVFNEDNTFVKSRTAEGKTEEAKGTYKLEEKGEERFFCTHF
ncbi:hypothetical protein LVD15_06445 [Fulvivirga maritima]|uniref:hypothetical protein n=1 Tax=Fulvivirga maritima TaxID=2904247 RepID=UPI001F2CC820|nr:hypothetical protein [Fulvivirga maritima]UII28061.1 hypothetical protein LVD15_06445 [Fulvivirga maritima]